MLLGFMQIISVVPVSGLTKSGLCFLGVLEFERTGLGRGVERGGRGLGF